MKKYYVRIESVECTDFKDRQNIILKRIIALLLAIIIIFVAGNKLFSHDYVLNPKSHIFHEKWCFAIQNSINVIHYNGTWIGAFFKGYSPCSNCIM